jgi:hypothetical protein
MRQIYGGGNAALQISVMSSDGQSLIVGEADIANSDMQSASLEAYLYLPADNYVYTVQVLKRSTTTVWEATVLNWEAVEDTRRQLQLTCSGSFSLWTTVRLPREAELAVSGTYDVALGVEGCIELWCRTERRNGFAGPVWKRNRTDAKISPDFECLSEEACRIDLLCGNRGGAGVAAELKVSGQMAAA